MYFLNLQEGRMLRYWNSKGLILVARFAEKMKVNGALAKLTEIEQARIHVVFSKTVEYAQMPSRLRPSIQDIMSFNKTEWLIWCISQCTAFPIENIIVRKIGWNLFIST